MTAVLSSITGAGRPYLFLVNPVPETIDETVLSALSSVMGYDFDEVIPEPININLAGILGLAKPYLTVPIPTPLSINNFARFTLSNLYYHTESTGDIDITDIAPLFIGRSVYPKLTHRSRPPK